MKKLLLFLCTLITVNTQAFDMVNALENTIGVSGLTLIVSVCYLKCRNNPYEDIQQKKTQLGQKAYNKAMKLNIFSNEDLYDLSSENKNTEKILEKINEKINEKTNKETNELQENFLNKKKQSFNKKYNEYLKYEETIKTKKNYAEKSSYRDTCVFAIMLSSLVIFCVSSCILNKIKATD